MRPVLTLALKDLRLILRDRVGLFFILVFPLLLALFFGSMFGGGGPRQPMTIAVIDDDRSGVSEAFAKVLAGQSAVRLQTVASLDDARQQVRRGKLVAYIRLRPGFGDLAQLFAGGGEAKLEVGSDPARLAERGMLQGVVVQATFQALQQRIADPKYVQSLVRQGIDGLSKDAEGGSLNGLLLKNYLQSLDTFLDRVDPAYYRSGLPGSGDAPTTATATTAATKDDDGLDMGSLVQIDFAEMAPDSSGQPRSNFDITFPSGISWGLIHCAAAFALALVLERTAGTMHRLRLSPLSFMQILAGKGLACFVLMTCDIALLMTIGVWIFHVHVSSYPLLAMAVVCSAFCFSGVMMLVSVLGRTEAAVSGIGWSFFMIWTMTGGAMIPLIMLKSWMVTLSHFSPVKWAIYALEGAIWRDFTTTEMLTPCAILIAIGVLFFSFGVWRFRRMEG